MNKRIPTFIGLILVCIAAWLSITSIGPIRSFMDRLDNLGYDLQLRTRILTKNSLQESNVAIIDIDDVSLIAEGRWPWPRSKIAQLVNRLNEEGAAVIAFDIFFSEHENNIAKSVLDKLKIQNQISKPVEDAILKNTELFDEDKILAEALQQTNAVMAIAFLPRKEFINEPPNPLIQMTKEKADELFIMEGAGHISNIPILQNAAKEVGFINIFPDTDGIIRHAPLIMEYKGGVYPSLALQSVLSFLHKDIDLVTPLYGKTQKLEGVKIGASIIPTSETGQVLIPFIGKSYTFPYYSATDVINKRIPKDALLGKILFLGTSATGLGDLHATAIQNPFPGVEIQATLVNGILMNSFSVKPAWTHGAHLVLIFLFGLIAAFSFPRFGPRLLGSVIVLFPPIMFSLNNMFWDETGYIISMLLPISTVLAIAIMNMIYGYLFESRRREKLKSMFGEYVPAKHIDEMLQASGGYALKGEDREMSVLFADIRNFTSISEGLSAAELVDMLNTFFTPMTKIIFDHRGTIDKYVGDLIMAFWGAPLKDKNHAKHAIESALEMQSQLKELQSTLAEHNWPEINIGIGINSGQMSVGDMGSQYRRNYTVLGDQVNLASRVEGLTKFYGVEIIVTESTQNDQPGFIFRKLDLVRVKGKKQGVAIYEAICKKSQATPALMKELSDYETALEAYFKQDWDKALEQMTALHHQFKERKIYKLYLERINEFKNTPPSTDWDGVYVHVTK